MSHGLKVWSASGNLQIDTTTRLGRVVSAGSSSIAAFSYLDVYVTGFAANDYWQVLVKCQNNGPLDVTKYTGYFRISNPNNSADTFTYWVVNR